jgi:hypothetical protein
LHRITARADAINGYGPGTMLHLQTGGSPFTAERCSRNLIIGYIGRFAPGNEEQIPFASEHTNGNGSGSLISAIYGSLSLMR